MKRMALICLLLVGCAEIERPTIQLQCGNCSRTIYDGPAEVRNGCKWPIGPINHCKPWDINCVSQWRDDAPHKHHWGYDAGRKDALEFRYHKEFDPEVYHPFYVEGYKKGYKEVIDVRREGTAKEDE